MAKCDFHETRGWKSYCLKKDDYISDSTYREYCNTYHYDECPLYKQSSSSGCYLTTACVECRGLQDNCRELTILRKFRDRYMAGREEGQADIKEYYEKAPLIVSAIDDKEDRITIYDKLYTGVIKPCVELIEQGKNEEAYSKYKNMVQELEQRFIKR